MKFVLAHGNNGQPLSAFVAAIHLFDGEGSEVVTRHLGTDIGAES